MNAYRTITDRPVVLWGISIAAAIVFGLLTSSVFGIGLFLILPGAVQWLMRRT